MTSTLSTIAGAVAATIAASTVVVAAGVVGAEADQQRVRQYPACAQEDGQLCIWRNHGPGFSFVSGPDTKPGPREEIHRYRVSDRLADKLIARDNWRSAPVGSQWDTTHGDRSFTAGKRAVISYGGTTYVIRLNGTVGTS